MRQNIFKMDAAEVARLKEYFGVKSNREVAKKIGISVSTVKSWIAGTRGSTVNMWSRVQTAKDLHRHEKKKKERTAS